MFLNLLHRPAEKPYQRPLFAFQQEVAHELGLKVTLMVNHHAMLDPETVDQIRHDAETYGDELGIWFDWLERLDYEDRPAGGDPLWLRSTDEKAWLIDRVLTRFRKTFGRDPLAVGAYHLDASCIELLTAQCPAIKIAVAGCFEEGVRVFHGCNNSWYLFNEGMPWGPWYPSKTHALRPAQDAADAAGIVAVPHLCRDLVLSYEGRNDFFATHPTNVQRAMANVGEDCPYMLNLVDQYRLQEDYNDGFSFCHVFVGPAWMSHHPTISDPDEVTQGLYREFLEYFVALREEGHLVDMTMSEFADWYREHVPMDKPQVAVAKDVLYGSNKDYVWYLDPHVRVLIDATQGGSIGDLRPYAGKVARTTGPDSPSLWYGSYPYLIHSQHRTGIAHHFADGARTTLWVRHGDEAVDLGTCRTHVAEVTRDGAGTHVRLTPAEVRFESGLRASIETEFRFAGQGELCITRRLVALSDPEAVLRVQEYVKACCGTTEYPEDMHGVQLAVEGAERQALDFAYHRRVLTTPEAVAAVARVPQVNTELRLEAGDGPCVEGQAIEGFMFSPYFTLTLESPLALGEEVRTWLKIKPLG
jgi:hypothetical protein